MFVFIGFLFLGSSRQSFANACEDDPIQDLLKPFEVPLVPLEAPPKPPVYDVPLPKECASVVIAHRPPRGKPRATVIAFNGLEVFVGIKE